MICRVGGRILSLDIDDLDLHYIVRFQEVDMYLCIEVSEAHTYTHQCLLTEDLMRIVYILYSACIPYHSYLRE